MDMEKVTDLKAKVLNMMLDSDLSAYELLLVANMVAREAGEMAQYEACREDK